MQADLTAAPGASGRVCVDLGTAMSKASAWLGGDVLGGVAPLPLGAAAGATHPLLAPSAMYVENGRVYLGPAALVRAQLGQREKRSPIVSFKMILAAEDLEAALVVKLRRTVDPTGKLRYRDALVLYLAYLDQLIRAAVAAEESLPASIADAPRRLTSPYWPSYHDAARIVSRLAEEAAIVSAVLGAALTTPAGIAIEQIEAALQQGEKTPSGQGFEGIVFESHAAASTYAHFARSTAPFVVVVDMGAGTTDLAGFERDGAAALIEIDAARQCSTLAGDELDHILVDLIVHMARARGLESQDRLWRATHFAIRDLKSELFQRGQVAIEHDGRRTVVKRDVVLRHPSVKAFCRALTDTIATSLAPTFVRAKQAKANAVAVLLAGGGANLPFLADLAKTAAAACKVRLPIAVERFGANWSLPHQHHPFAGMFPQMAISMGGALSDLVDEKAALSPAQLAAAEG
jgi:molecular chaperone DnaK (HSP70)